MLERSQIERLTRQLWACGIYRWILGFAASVTLMRALPGAEIGVGLAFLFVNQVALAGDLLGQARTAAVREQMEMSDRKTRHAILLAAQSAGREGIPEWDFWPEVNRRVSDEVDAELGTKTSWWSNVGLVVGQIAWTAICDMIVLGIALAVAG